MFEKVKEIIAEKLSINEDDITMDSSFVDDLNADSLDLVELMMALEDELDTEIPDEEAENFKTVGDVVKSVLKSKLKNKLQGVYKMAKFNIKEVEDSIGLTFNEPKLLKTALTHSSYANQHKDQEYNERFEFLGDSILQLCITEYLFLNYKNKSEGELTKIRSLIVCENSLYEIGKKLNLGYFIRISRGEELTGGRERVSIIADAVEALLAGIYLDKGLEFVKDYIIGHFKEIIDKAINNDIVLDYKTKLQEEMQKSGEVSIIYELLKYEGPPHRRKFFTSVLIEDRELGKGEGYSKKESEQNAAKEALRNLEELNE